MKTVNVGELKDGLSGFLQYVKDGEEIVIRDLSVAVARLLPFRRGIDWNHEEPLVASGAMKMPEQEINWDQFFLSPAGNVSKERAIDISVDSRGDW